MPTSPEIRDFQRRGTKYAIETAAFGGANLDLSAESVALLEDQLAFLHEAVIEDPTLEGMEGCAMFYGAYLVSVFERIFGDGTWESNHPEIGDHTYPFYIMDITIFPIEWCRKRIFNGPADDVHFKFQALCSGLMSSHSKIS